MNKIKWKYKRTTFITSFIDGNIESRVDLTKTQYLPDK